MCVLIVCILFSLTLRHMKSGGQELTFGTDSCAFQPKGVLFFRATRGNIIRND